MLKLRFHSHKVSMIMCCVHSVSYKALQNGEELRPILPQSSPYLYYSMDSLSVVFSCNAINIILSKQKKNKNW